MSSPTNASSGDILSQNDLVQDDKGVYRLGQHHGLDYSDGRSTEIYLEQVLTSITDLGSRSHALQEAIVDWPSEYHLSSDRANILRSFNLEGPLRVLELGSGCGAISRYLGELGHTVDAIEGSPVRANLGRLRCRDLDNVRVICANYNDLELPHNHYDLILSIGVIEYASKFFPRSEEESSSGPVDDRRAATGIMRQSRSLLANRGMMIVAIENRLGLKYILGQHEDHYSKRFVGIDGYRDSAGIATYSESEWRDIIYEAGYSHSLFTYPFPDYKIPRLSLGEDYVRKDPHAFNHLEGVFSRDYTRPVRKSPIESIAWQAANSGEFLGSVANSFCILVGDDETALHQAANYDFCHLPGPGRKNRFAVVTSKPRGQDIVLKQPLEAGTTEDLPLTQNLSAQDYLHGDLLSTLWLRSILIHARREEFDALLGDYHTFLGNYESSGNTLQIDLLPINIIVDRQGTFHSFDQEWEVDWQITREYLLFRALLTFIVTNWIHMKDFLGWLELDSVQDFVDYGFRNHNLLLEKYLDGFVDQENRFQSLITHTADDRDVRGLLATRFDFTEDDREIYARLFWRSGSEEFDLAQSVEQVFEPSPEPQVLTFDLAGIDGAISAIRLDPFDIRKTDKVGFFSVNAIRVIAREEESSTVLWELAGDAEIARLAEAESASFLSLGHGEDENGEEGGRWIASTDFPKLTLRPPEPLAQPASARVMVEVTLSVCESAEYILARQQYISASREVDRLKSDLHKTLHHLDSARSEIRSIKEGRPFRLGMKIFSLLNRLKGGGRPS